MTSGPTSSPRITPSVPAALGLVLVYAITIVVAGNAGSVAYNDWFDSAHNTWRSAVPMLAAGSLVIVAFLAWARWGRPVFRDPERLPMPRVLWVPPIVMTLGIVLRLVGEPWGDTSLSFFLAVLVTGILVGFAEETVFRGVLIRGLRDGVRTEPQVALISSAAFGLFHLTNLTFSSPLLGAMGQVVLAGLSGVTFYLVRRGFGSLVPAMIMHGTFDISLFLQGGEVPDNAVAGAGYAVVVLSYVLGVVALVWLHRHDRGTILGDAGLVAEREAAPAM